MIMLQSETCEIIVPSLEFVSAAGLSSGRFTTLEGLLTNVKDQVGSFKTKSDRKSSNFSF